MALQINNMEVAILGLGKNLSQAISVRKTVKKRSYASGGYDTVGQWVLGLIQAGGMATIVLFPVVVFLEIVEKFIGFSLYFYAISKCKTIGVLSSAQTMLVLIIEVVPLLNKVVPTMAISLYVLIKKIDRKMAEIQKSIEDLQKKVAELRRKYQGIIQEEQEEEYLMEQEQLAEEEVTDQARAAPAVQGYDANEMIRGTVDEQYERELADMRNRRG